jgi:hypothetical protein
MRIQDLQYDLPPELIAQRPAEPATLRACWYWNAAPAACSTGGFRMYARFSTLAMCSS